MQNISLEHDLIAASDNNTHYQWRRHSNYIEQIIKKDKCLTEKANDKRKREVNSTTGSRHRH